MRTLPPGQLWMRMQRELVWVFLWSSYYFCLIVLGSFFIPFFFQFKFQGQSLFKKKGHVIDFLYLRYLFFEIFTPS